MLKLFIIVALGLFIYALSKAWLIIPAGLVMVGILVLFVGILWKLRK